MTVRSYSLLLEDGGHLLLEDGVSRLLLEFDRLPDIPDAPDQTGRVMLTWRPPQPTIKKEKQSDEEALVLMLVLVAATQHGKN